MKTAVLTGIRSMEIRDVPGPAIRGNRDVLIDMGAIGVCGSDIHYYTTGRIGSQVVSYPFMVGHECAGRVAAVGAAVTRVRPGDVVAIDPAMPCGACDQCRGGRPHTCRKLRFLGCPGQADGCLAEQLVMPEECCLPVGPRTTIEQAALSEPFAIGVYAVAQSVPMPGAAIGILGAGPIGLSILAAARAGNPARAYVTDRIDARLAAARRAGATWTGNPDRTDVVAEIGAAEPLLLDVVFECCGQQEALDQAVGLLKPGGKLMIVGIPEAERISFNIDRLRRRELCLQNVRRQNGCVARALDLIERRTVDLDFMVTHRFPLARTREAFDLVAAYADGVIKAMIIPD